MEKREEVSLAMKGQKTYENEYYSADEYLNEHIEFNKFDEGGDEDE